MKTFPSPYAVAEVVAVASEYEGGSATLDSEALESTILEIVKFKDSVFLEFGERMRCRMRCRTRVGKEKRRWRGWFYAYSARGAEQAEDSCSVSARLYPSVTENHSV